MLMTGRKEELGKAKYKQIQHLKVINNWLFTSNPESCCPMMFS